MTIQLRASVTQVVIAGALATLAACSGGGSNEQTSTRSETTPVGVPIDEMRLVEKAEEMVLQYPDFLYGGGPLGTDTNNPAIPDPIFESLFAGTPLVFVDLAVQAIPGLIDTVSGLVGINNDQCDLFYGGPFDEPIIFPNYCGGQGEMSGWDTFWTVDTAKLRPGAGEVDTHVGSDRSQFPDDLKEAGTIGDLFVVGDHKSPYYASKQRREDKDNDFLYVKRLESQSRIQLWGDPSKYASVYVDVRQGADDYFRQYRGTAVFLRETEDMVLFVWDRRPEQIPLDRPPFVYAKAPDDQQIVRSPLPQFGDAGIQNNFQIALDPYGNLYQVSHSNFIPGVSDSTLGSFFITKYDSTGKVIWRRFHGTDGPTVVGEFVFEVRATADAVFVSGGTKGGYGGASPDGNGLLGDSKGFVAKYDANSGDLLNVVLPADSDNTDDLYNFATTMTTDDSGHLLVAGGRFPLPNPTRLLQPWVAKLDQEGLETVWRVDVGSSVGINEVWGNIDYLEGSKPGQGKILICGYTMFGAQSPMQRDMPEEEKDGKHNAWFAVLNASDGKVLFIREFGTKNYAEYAWDCKFDRDGGIFVAGATDGPLNGAQPKGETDGFIGKWSSSGVRLWIKLIGGDYSDMLQNIAVRADGKIVGAGTTSSSLFATNACNGHPQCPDYATYKPDAFAVILDSEGEVLQGAQVGTEQPDFVFGMAQDATGIYVSGYTMGSLTGPNKGATDAFVLKFSQEDLSVIEE
jgi:hypothetical protein